MLGSSPDAGVTTDVRVVEAVIKYLERQNKSLKIIVLESNSDYDADKAFERLGYRELEGKHNITLCNLSKDKTLKIQISKSKKISYLEVPETLLFIDHFISVAKLKTHAFECMSGVWKNQFGLIPRKSIRPRFHPFLPQILYDLNGMFCPDLSIIDGIYALEGPGPLEGKPKRMDIIICGRNPLSTDIVASKIMGFNHKKVPHIKYALKHGLKDAENIMIVGNGFEFSVHNENKFTFIPYTQYKLYRLSLFLGRMGRYLENAGEVAFTSAYAIRTAGFSHLASGRMFSIKKIMSEVKELLFKIEA